eukprot:scaffold119540_cov66-Phaeocystis_antarctica.AAC.5
MHGSVRDGVHRRAPHRVHHLSTRSMARSGFGGTRVRVATRKPRATSCRRRYAYCGYTCYGYSCYGYTSYGGTYHGVTCYAHIHCGVRRAAGDARRAGRRRGPDGGGAQHRAMGLVALRRPAPAARRGHERGLRWPPRGVAVRARGGRRGAARALRGRGRGGAAAAVRALRRARAGGGVSAGLARLPRVLRPPAALSRERRCTDHCRPELECCLLVCPPGFEPLQGNRAGRPRRETTKTNTFLEKPLNILRRSRKGTSHVLVTGLIPLFPDRDTRHTLVGGAGSSPRAARCLRHPPP